MALSFAVRDSGENVTGGNVPRMNFASLRRYVAIMSTITELVRLAKAARGDPLLRGLNEVISSHGQAQTQRMLAGATASGGGGGGGGKASASLKSMLYLYADTTNSTANFVSKAEAQASPLLIKANARNLAQLAARHAGAIDTLVEIFSGLDEMTAAVNARESVSPEAILEAQISLTILLEHAAEISDLKAPTALGVVRVREPLLSMCDYARTQTTALADHNVAEELCPTIEIDEDSMGGMMLTCVPSVVEFTLLESMKNAVYATMVQAKADGRSFTPPPVVVRVAESADKVVVEVIDQGIGMTASECVAALQYRPHSARSTKGMVDDNLSYQPMSAPLRGFGVGCMLSQRYLNATALGHLTLSSPGRGQGATATLSLQKYSDPQ